MKKQITIVFVAAIILTGLISIVMFMRREKQMALQWLTENSRSQLDLMGDLLENDLEQIKNQLARVATLMEAGQSEDVQKYLGGFISVAAINPDTSEFLWKTKVKSDSESEMASSAGGVKDEWSGSWVTKVLEASKGTGEMKFYVHQLTNGDVRSAVTLLAKVRDRRSGQATQIKIIGISSKVLFQDLVDKLRAQGVHLFLTTENGLTLAHTVAEYVGNSMVGDRTYEEIRNQRNVFGSIISKDVRGDEILSFYVKLPMAQLTLVSQWRKALWVNHDWAFYGQSFFLLLALALMFGVFSQYLLKQIKEGEIREVPVEKIVERIIEKVIEKPVVQAPSFSEKRGGRSEQAQRFEASDVPAPAIIPPRPSYLFSTPVPVSESSAEAQISLKTLDKVISVLKAPLLSVLGHVQIARVNPQGGALHSIEAEVRNAQDILDKMGQFSGQSYVPSVTVPLHELMESALRSIEGAVLRGNIKIIRDIPTDIAIKCDVDDFRTALAALLRNSVEAMEKSLRKTLTLKAKNQEGTISLEIDDTGEGITPENLCKIYEPFFTTRSPLDHKGLGLSVASGILRQHRIQIQVKSQIGEGTLFSLKIPQSAEVVHSLSERGISLRRIKDASVPTPVDVLKNEDQEDSVESSVVELAQSPGEKTALAAGGGASTEPSFSNERVFQTEFAGHDPMSFINDDDEDSFGEFQFGRLDFNEEREGGAMESLESHFSATAPATSATPLSSSLDKRLKKKEEPLAKIKVQIPRPEERL